MSFEDALNTFMTEEEFQRAVEKSTLGEAEEILAKVTDKAGRGEGLSLLERAILDHHFPNILEEQEQDPPYAPWSDTHGK